MKKATNCQKLEGGRDSIALDASRESTILRLRVFPDLALTTAPAAALADAPSTPSQEGPAILATKPSRGAICLGVADGCPDIGPVAAAE